MPTPSPDAAGVSHRFGLVIDGLCRLVASRIAQERAAGPIIILIWNRLRRIAARFARLAADPGRRIGVKKRPLAAALPRPPVARPALRWPRGLAWLMRAVPGAAVFGSQLRHLLEDPEFAALLAAEPRISRLLRPLCRALAVEPPGAPTPPDPKPPKTSRPAPPPSRRVMPVPYSLVAAFARRTILPA